MFLDSDNVNSRTFSSASYANATGMTVESCINFCSTGSNSYIYAGVEYADECCELIHLFYERVGFNPTWQTVVIRSLLVLRTRVHRTAICLAVVILRNTVAQVID